MRADIDMNNSCHMLAWLIHQEVEKYVLAHEPEYQEWAQARTAADSEYEGQANH